MRRVALVITSQTVEVVAVPLKVLRVEVEEEEGQAVVAVFEVPDTLE